MTSRWFYNIIGLASRLRDAGKTQKYVFNPGCGSAWLERRLREAEVASSNPATPIHCKVLDFQGLFLLHFMLYHGTFLISSMFPFGVSL